jgi:hypothetical protein
MAETMGPARVCLARLRETSGAYVKRCEWYNGRHHVSLHHYTPANSNVIKSSSKVVWRKEQHPSVCIYILIKKEANAPKCWVVTLKVVLMQGFNQAMFIQYIELLPPSRCMWLVIRSIQLVFQWKINGFVTYNPCFVGQSMIKLRSQKQYALPKSKWELLPPFINIRCFSFVNQIYLYIF